MKIKAFSVCRYYTVTAHFCNSLPAKRGGCKDPVQYIGPLLRRFHPGHLHPCHSADAPGGGRYHRLRHRPGDVRKAENDTGPDGDPRPGLLSLDISKAQSYITDFLVIDRKFFGCGPSIIPVFRPVRSAPHSRMGHGLGQRERAEINRLKKCSKTKKNRANRIDLHGCGGDYRTRICDLLRVNICQVKSSSIYCLLTLFSSLICRKYCGCIPVSPLFPPRFFLFWVRIWVRQKRRAGSPA